VSDIGNQRYSEDEVSRIIKRALQSGDDRDTISHAELMDIADKSGVSHEALEAVLRDEDSSRELEDAKVLWLKRHRQDFHNHLRSFVIVNGVLVMMNMMTSRYPWALWPIMGWGIGLLFHASDTYFVSEDRIDKGARKILKKRRKVSRAREWAVSAAREFGAEDWLNDNK
jgi:hypothetical protein